MISIFLGTVTGIIDVIPMIIQGLNWYANLSAFFHCVVLGFNITYVVINIKSWLKGLIIAEISAIPIVILVYQNNPEGILPILIMSAVLGSLIGVFGEKYAR